MHLHLIYILDFKCVCGIAVGLTCLLPRTWFAYDIRIVCVNFLSPRIGARLHLFVLLHATNFFALTYINFSWAWLHALVLVGIDLTLFDPFPSLFSHLISYPRKLEPLRNILVHLFGVLWWSYWINLNLEFTYDCCPCYLCFQISKYFIL